MTKPRPQGYSGLQIGLHWAVAMLVLVQFLGSDGIEQAWRAFRRGDATMAPGSTVWLHIGVGATIFVLAIWRLWLRHTRGAPPPPEREARPLRWIATATHVLIYVLIVGMPISGAVAWFGGGGQAAAAHVFGKTILLALVILHVAGALFQHVVLKTKVLSRMLMAEEDLPTRGS